MTLALRPQTREQWLESAVLALRPLLLEARKAYQGKDEVAPRDLPQIRVSVGWPSKGGTRSKGKVIGQCWKACVASDGVPQIFISPVLRQSAPKEVLGVLLHEMIHAWDDCESGHQKRFRRVAKAVGLRGKMTATVVEEDSPLAERLTEILDTLGPYPHTGLNFEEMEKVAGKQGTRMLKLECPEDGYLVRTTAKWLEIGLPKCPCGAEMQQA